MDNTLVDLYFLLNRIYAKPKGIDGGGVKGEKLLILFLCVLFEFSDHVHLLV